MQDLISAITSLAGLFHDVGKATSGFQRKLQINTDEATKNNYGPDPIKHELMSVLILEAWMSKHWGAFGKMDDASWLSVMADPVQFSRSMKSVFKGTNLVDEASLLKLHTDTCDKNIPSLALVADTQLPAFICSAVRYALLFMVVSHHKMPTNDFIRKRSIYPLLADPFIDQESKWRKGVWSSIPSGKKQLWDDPQSPWMQEVAQVAQEVSRLLPELRSRLEGSKVAGAAFMTAVTHIGRVALIQADFEVSSRRWEEPNHRWQDSAVGWANTVGDERPGQPLDEHLLRVGQLVPRYVNRLCRSGGKIDRPIPALSDTQLGNKFRWQIEAEQLLGSVNRDEGLMILLMAGTGTGKTIGGARLMKAISPEGMRFNVALGLRTLTLQTMDSYKRSLGLHDNEVALMMGCDVEKAIHKAKADYSEQGAGHGLDHVTDHVVVGAKSFSKLRDKMTIFEDCPIVVSTIDSIIDSAVSSRNTGVLSTTRIATSDIIIDEVDSYSENDLVSVAKLVYLTGFFGRVPVLSSATVTPEIAQILFHAFRSGYAAGAAYRGEPAVVNVAWISEEYEVNQLRQGIDSEAFIKEHEQFVTGMIEQLSRKPQKRKAEILPLEVMTMEAAFGIMERACVRLHRKHHEIDLISGKRLSFGLVRLSTVESCKDFALYLKSRYPLADVELKICCYHSQQMVGYQHCYEEFYNSVLNRKPVDGKPAIFNNAIIRGVINNTDRDDVLLIMVSSPIEEVGRDHDFDWGIVEPTSLRAVIQTAGRQYRHREIYASSYTMMLLGTTLRSIRFPYAKEFFAYPGPETPNGIDDSVFPSFTKNTRCMVNTTYLRKGIDSRECVLPSPQSELSRRERTVQRLHFWPTKNAPGNLNASSYLDVSVLRFSCSHSERLKFRGNNETVSYAHLNVDEWSLTLNGTRMNGNYSENLDTVDHEHPVWLYVPSMEEVDRRYRSTFSHLTDEAYRSIMYVFSVNKYEKEGIPKVGYSIQSGAYKIKHEGIKSA